MENDAYLTFSLHGLLLAVDTKAVREITWLPELTVIEECPPYIAGVVNMHGTVVPVIDVTSRFGHPRRGYSCTDRLIILDISAFRTPHSPFESSALELFGIIVTDVLDVIDIPQNEIELPPFEGIETEAHPHFVSGVAKSDQNIIMILNPLRILDSEFELPQPELDHTEIPESTANGYFSPDAGQGEREIFHNRSITLQKTFGSRDASKVIPVAVVSLHNEYLCVELESVREFSKIHTITPVPCCPEHIVGNMNLRGNILTVVDIRWLLNMQVERAGESARVMVVDTGEFSVGVIVDEILDVVTISENDIAPVSSSIRVLDDTFVKGVVPYGSRMMALLDFKEILSWDGLIVNEEV